MDARRFRACVYQVHPTYRQTTSGAGTNPSLLDPLGADFDPRADFGGAHAAVILASQLQTGIYQAYASGSAWLAADQPGASRVPDSRARCGGGFAACAFDQRDGPRPGGEPRCASRKRETGGIGLVG